MQVLLEENQDKELDMDKATEQANMLIELHGIEYVTEHFNDILATYPSLKENTDWLFRVGTIMLDNGDEKGIEIINQIIDNHWNYKFNGLYELMRYYHLFGDQEQEKETKERLESWEKQLEKSNAELNSIHVDMEYDEVKDVSILDDVKNRLSERNEVERAYLFARTSKAIPDRTALYLLIEFNDYAFKRDMRKIRDNMYEEWSFPQELYVGIINFESVFEESADRNQQFHIYQREKKKKEKKKKNQEELKKAK